MTDEKREFDMDCPEFDEWFRRNEDLCHEMMKQDPKELLFEAWLAGYVNGMSLMHGTLTAFIEEEE